MLSFSNLNRSWKNGEKGRRVACLKNNPHRRIPFFIAEISGYQAKKPVLS